MDAIYLTETLIGREVERLFSENPAQSNGLCTNPVTGQYYVRGVDPIAPQKEAAYRALLAREWFAFTAPPDATPLPINGTTAKTGSERGGYWITSSRYTLGRWMIGMT